MYAAAVLTTTCLIIGALANPLPANVDVPISDSEWQSLKEAGLRARSAQSNVNQPITDAEWQALREAGLSKREDAASSIFRRDKTMNCGHKVTGKGGSNGHGKWVPVDKFVDQADTFCKSQSLSDWQDRRWSHIFICEAHGVLTWIWDRPSIYWHRYRKGP